MFAPPRPPLATAQPVPIDNSNKCAQVVVLGLRGSGDAPKALWDPNNSGGFGKWYPPTFADEQDGFGPNAYDIYYGFQSRLTQTKPGTTLKAVGIQYLGLNVPVLGFLDLQPVTVNDYIASIFDGTDKLITRMYKEVSDCNNTKFVLTGYSQGALAIHVALRRSLPVTRPC